MSIDFLDIFAYNFGVGPTLTLLLPYYAMVISWKQTHYHLWESPSLLSVKYRHEFTVPLIFLLPFLICFWN